MKKGKGAFGSWRQWKKKGWAEKAAAFSRKTRLKHTARPKRERLKKKKKQKEEEEVS